MKFCNELETRFRKESNRELAVPMENYMKNNFSFLGLKTEKRREIFKLIYEQNKAEINQMVLTIPAMTGINTREDIAKALGQVQQKDLLKWAKEHIPKTRQAIRRSNKALARLKDVRLSSA